MATGPHGVPTALALLHAEVELTSEKEPVLIQHQLTEVKIVTARAARARLVTLMPAPPLLHSLPLNHHSHPPPPSLVRTKLQYSTSVVWID